MSEENVKIALAWQATPSPNIVEYVRDDQTWDKVLAMWNPFDHPGVRVSSARGRPTMRARCLRD